MSIDCVIYRCSKRSGLYLYLRADLTEEDLSAELTALTGKISRSFDLTLTASSKLAREDVHKVMANLKEQGFHLQLPPPDIPTQIQQFGI